MKSKPDIDLDRPASSPHRLWPIRSIWQLMAVVAVIGMFLAVTVPLARQPLSSIASWDPSLSPASASPMQLAAYQAFADARQPLVTGCLVEAPETPTIADQPLDRTVIVAPDSIDPKMVVRAPEWIDPTMVFTPNGAEVQADPGALPDLAPRVPGIAPGTGPQYRLVPVPEGSGRPAKDPRYKLVPVPDGSVPPGKRPRSNVIPTPDRSLPPATKPRQR